MYPNTKTQIHYMIYICIYIMNTGTKYENSINELIYIYIYIYIMNIGPKHKKNELIN